MASYYPAPQGAPYPPPAGDPYRPYPRDYERERDYEKEWADYERDRAEWEYRNGVRGRSRSPGASLDDDRRLKRRRSMSPYDRERYEPRPRYNDDYDRGRYSPRRNNFGGRRAPVDPYTLDYPVTFKHFCEWLRFTQPGLEAEDKKEQEKGDAKNTDSDSRQKGKWDNGWGARYEKYKKDILANQLRKLFDFHRKSAWFIERYDPSPQFVAQRARVRHEGWSGRLQTFVEELERGKWLPELELEASEPKKGSVTDGADDTKKTGEGGDVGMDTEQGAEKAPAADADEPTSPTETEPPKEDQGEVTPTSPDAEQMGDPSIRADTADPLTSPTSAAPKPDLPSGDARVDRRASADEQVLVQPEGNQILIRTIPPHLTRVKIEEVCRGVPGFVYLALGDPQPKKNFYRPGWVKYDDQADMDAAVRHFGEQRIDGFTMHVVHNTEPYPSRVRVAPPLASRFERMQKDLDNVRTLAEILESEWDALQNQVKEDEKEVRRKAAEVEAARAREDGNDNGNDARMEDMEQVEVDLNMGGPKERGYDIMKRKLEELLGQLKKKAEDEKVDEEVYKTAETRVSLDFWLTYIRQAFNTCYYCALVCDHEEALQRKCVKHTRLPYVKPSPQDEEVEKEGLLRKRPSDDRWVEWLEAKVALLLDRAGVDPRDYGGMNYDEQLARIVEPHVKQEDEGKYRCKTCSKLFKAPTFVEKHVANKHPELIKDSLQDLPFFNNFALDPTHILPQHHAAATAGPQNRDAHGPGGQHYDNRGGRRDSGGYRHPDEQGGYPQTYGYPPPHNGNGYGYPPPPFAQPAQWTPQPMYDDRRRSPPYSGRLSDRMGDFAPTSESDQPRITLPEGLPAKPTGALDMGRESSEPGRRSRPNAKMGPPPNAKMDPRAAAGRRVSYHDMDQVAEGDVELNY